MVLTRAMRKRAAGGPEGASRGCTELSADEWQLVAAQLGGADGSTWRGSLRGVCRAARDGVDGAGATAQCGRRLDPQVLARRVALLRWAVEQGCDIVDDVEVLTAAIFDGRLRVLQWGVQSRCWVLPPRLCLWATMGGYLEMLQWARAQGCPWDEWTCIQAAKRGHLEVLQWARGAGCPWHQSACVFAALLGRLEVLRWAREQGFQCDDMTCTWAVHAGNLELLQWARGEGCPWDAEQCWHMSVSHEHHAITEWIERQL